MTQKESQVDPTEERPVSKMPSFPRIKHFNKAFASEGDFKQTFRGFGSDKGFASKTIDSRSAKGFQSRITDSEKGLGAGFGSDRDDKSGPKRLDL